MAVVQRSHLGSDILGRSDPAVRAGRFAVKLADAAKRAIEQTAATRQHRSHRNPADRLESVSPSGPRERIEIVHQRTCRVDDDLAAAPEHQALNSRKVLWPVHIPEQFLRRDFALEADYRIEFRQRAHGVFRTQARVMSSGGKVRAHSCSPEGGHQITELAQVVLKNDGKADQSRGTLKRGANHAVVGIRAIWNQSGLVAFGFQVRHYVPKSQVLLVLPTDENCFHLRLPPSGRSNARARQSRRV